MPSIKLQTSAPIPAGEEGTAILKAFSSRLAALLGKPESYVMTSLVPAAMTFAGSSEPACLVEVANLGELAPEQTKEITAAVCDLLEERLNVPAARTYVGFASPERHMWGWDRQTFAK